MSIAKIQGGVPIHLWAPVHEVESAALDQLRHISALPVVFHHVSAMADCHLGKGATVGSVVPTKDAISPAMVGVDIGCLDNHTEYLTREGWKKMPEWAGEEILIYDPASDEGRFSKPSRYIVEDCAEFFHFKNSKGLDQMLSHDHRVAVWQGHKARGYDLSVMTPEQLAEKNTDKGYYCFKTTFQVSGPGVDISDAILRLEVMVQADGRVRVTPNGNYVELHFRKDRKVQRAQELLKAAGIDYELKIWNDGSTAISFQAGVNCSKDLSKFWNANTRQLKVIAEEALKWDGHEGYRSYYASTSRASADLIQFAFAGSGVRAGIHDRSDKRNATWARMHYVIPTKNEMVGFSKPSRVPSEDGKKYCFTVETGFFVARRNGHIFITGNCGMGAVRTNLRAEDLPESLRDIRLATEETIPVGNGPEGGHATAALKALGSSKEVLALTKRVNDLFGRWKALTEKVSGDQHKAVQQLGTLGGGNHFIELCLDTEGSVWLMLHSGSRWIGKTLAEYHMGVAKKLEHNSRLPDKDLAYFLSGTKEMAAYRHDLFWAQEYAFLNREVMFELYKAVIRKFFPHVQYEAPILCHHNYVAEEVHYGEKVFVTRKGAISAHEGVMGIIPGSMGTRSYIVRGKGSEEAFSSASHGAGRRMSRGEAKRQFTVEDIAVQTAGVECRKDAGVLDEIPACYKDIDQVMANQSDLVEVVATLKQVMTVKG